MRQDEYPTLSARRPSRPETDGRADVLLAATGDWASSAKLAVALLAAGLKVATAAPARNLVRAAPGLASAFDYAPPRPARALARAIEASGCALVIPCDERALGHLHEISTTLAQSPAAAVVRRSLGPSEAFPVVQDRAALLEMAAGLGVETPPFARVSGPQDLARFGAAQGWPAAVKRNGSFGGRGVRRVEGLPAALAASAALASPLRPRDLARALRARNVFAFDTPTTRAGLVVQAWIDGRPANCAVFAIEGEIRAAIAVEVLETHGEHGPSSLVRRIDGADMTEAARRIVRALGLSGFAGFDFILDAGSGRAQLLEMNARAAPPCHIRRPGGDLVSALAEHLGVRPAPPEGPDPERIAYFPDTEIAGLPPERLAGAVSDRPVGAPAYVDLIHARCVSRRARRRNPRETAPESIKEGPR